MLRSALIVLALTPALYAASTMEGTVRDASQIPVEGVTITAHNLAGLRSFTATSGKDGTFKVPDLKPGKYELLASKSGFEDFKLSPLDLADNQTAKSDVPLTPAKGPVKIPGFWKRFGNAYHDDWFVTSTDTDAPKYRGNPAPVSNPPYPFTDWPMGGTVYIGLPNATQYPLTTALQTGPHGDWWKKANIQLYGWADLGMNISTSHTGPYANAPAAYSQIANSFTLDQATFYIERTPDTVQTDHFDWGFRLTNLYGFDYRFTTAEGYFSQQLLNNPKANGTIGNKYGYDPVMAYVDLYFPHVAQGMDVRVGRYISLPDIEAQLAPNNYTYSHSLLYTYDCYTQTGVNATIKLSNHWLVQAGLSGGCEAAPWAKNATLTGNACVAYKWSQGKDDVYVCVNSINSGKYNYNNLAAYYVTWYHQFGKSKWHMDWESWYQYMKDTPNVNNPLAAPLLVTNSNGAYCNHTNELTCFANDYASVVYVTRQLSKKDAIIARTEDFNDLKGQRTGFKTNYSESAISWNHWIGSTIVFRPEVRYDHAFDAPAYNSGTKKSQLMFAADMILFY